MFKTEREKLEQELKTIESQLKPLIEKQKIAELTINEKQQLSGLAKQYEATYLKLEKLNEQEKTLEANLVYVNLDPQPTNAHSNTHKTASTYDYEKDRFGCAALFCCCNGEEDSEPNAKTPLLTKQ